MPKAEQANPETLFTHWRRGDAAAGQAMAQCFTDWYYAIAVSRFGDAEGEELFRSAASKFSKGVVKVEDARRLMTWAHQIVKKQLAQREGPVRNPNADLPNAFTRKRSPKQILTEARAFLPDQMNLLERTYRGENVGGDPQMVLQARYALKAWLRTHLEIPFKVTPTRPDPDNTPLPWYEAGLLSADSDETLFEIYMLGDQEICQDVAEFAHYALALRGGLGGQTPVTGTRPAPRQLAPEVTRSPDLPAQAPEVAAPTQIAPVENASNTPFAVMLVLFLLVILLLIGVTIKFQMAT